MPVPFWWCKEVQCKPKIRTLVLIGLAALFKISLGGEFVNLNLIALGCLCPPTHECKDMVSSNHSIVILEKTVPVPFLPESLY